MRGIIVCFYCGKPVVFGVPPTKKDLSPHWYHFGGTFYEMACALCGWVGPDFYESCPRCRGVLRIHHAVLPV